MFSCTFEIFWLLFSAERLRLIFICLAWELLSFLNLDQCLSLFLEFLSCYLLIMLLLPLFFLHLLRWRLNVVLSHFILYGSYRLICISHHLISLCYILDNVTISSSSLIFSSIVTPVNWVIVIVFCPPFSTLC